MKICAGLIGMSAATALMVSSAFAAGPLPAGKPAGVKRAQLNNDLVVPLVLAGALVAGLAVVASQHGSTTVVVSTGTAA